MRRKFKVRKLFIAALAASLSACATPLITMDEIQIIERGQHATAIKELLNAEPYDHIDITVDGTPYHIDLYEMQVGIRYFTSVGYCGRNCSYVHTYPVPVTEPYAFVYKHEMLLTWGFIEELRKSEDLLVIKLSEMIPVK